MRLAPIVVGLALVTSLIGEANADRHRFGGLHPINAEDGMCYIEAPHVHAYAPYKVSVLFRKHDGRHHFVGDPVAYGYDGEQFSYHGHHPIEIDDVDHYCYIDGAHFHHHAPAVTASFEIKGGIHWYVGDFGPRYKKHLYKKKRVNALYADFQYERPVIHVDPPAAYAGVVVSLPTPTLSVEIGATIGRARLVAGKHHHKRAHKYKLRKGPKVKHKRKYKRKHKVKRSKRKHKRSKRNRRWQF